MDVQEVKTLLDEQATVFEQFKKANDARLKAIDTGMTEQSMKAEELAKMEARLGEIQDQLDKSETERKRLSGLIAADPGVQSSAESKAFWQFARKGADRLDAEERKVLTVGDDTQAGYLAPKEYVMEIIKGASVFSPIRSIARIRTTSNKAIQVPRRTAQFSAAWVAETGTRSETTGLTYGLEEIPTHEMYALVDVSNQELEDSVFDLEAELKTEYEERFGVAEGTAFVSGTGVGKPEGFLTSVNSDVSSTNSGAATTIADAGGQANGLIELAHLVKEAYAANGTWVMNRVTLGSVRKLKDDQKNYIWQPGVAGSLPNTILGRPYIEATDMPAEAANAYPIAFGDFRRGYMIVDRIAISVLRDPYTQATSGAVRFIARKRVGGKVVLAEAIRCLKCSA